MRIVKTDTVAGLPAKLARELIRLAAGGGELYAEQLQWALDRHGSHSAAEVIAKFVEEGYLEAAINEPTLQTWKTTIRGNALAMASFGRPLKRATADRLLAGLVQRATQMNADPAELFFVDRLRVFGSYLDLNRVELGDVDVELVATPRRSVAELIGMGQRALPGRGILEQNFWAHHKMIRTLRNRSAYLHLTTEDVDRFTDTSHQIFERDI